MKKGYPVGAPSWIDLCSTDLAGSHCFYGALFGWTAQELGPEAKGVGFYLKDDRMVAGFGPATESSRRTSWAVYFHTRDVTVAADRVVKLGGRVVARPLQVFDNGWMAVFADPAGAYFSVWQPEKHLGSEVSGVPGSLSWAELYTSDVEAAKAFYTNVLDVSARGPLLESGDVAVAGVTRAAQNRWAVCFAVEDVDVATEQALAMGGSRRRRHDSPAGRLAVLTDPQGGRFGLIGPTMGHAHLHHSP
ncbi:VOC family protein [Allorhizocola rhizosphaerae]|uniref:VOC family protein n=1 Tax=Allorhizocola rhizosphaerae TaxID=1872709 RepID=UPI0013C33140|nr:VOC family protein [Allorhizocola rhizosphaerae]